MKRTTLLAIAAGAIFGSVGAASAQGIYLDLGPRPWPPSVLSRLRRRSPLQGQGTVPRRTVR
jgi:hypothetical protein